MKITDIGVIPIAMPLVARHHDRAGRMRMYDMDQHVVVKVHTDNGLVGYGDYDYWVDDGSVEYRRVSARLNESGSFSE
mgnify:FL=1